MHDVGYLIHHYGLIVVFAAVLLEGLGLPLPAFAVVLVAAGSSYDQTHALPALVFLIAFGAGLAGDVFWFWAGRRYGYRLLGALCRISLSPDSCVQRTESLFVRWGSSTLLVARFVPGLSVVAQPLAGVVRRTWSSFLVYDGLGLVLWAGAATALGVMFSSAVDDVLDTLSRYGAFGALIVAAALALFVLYKALQRYVLIRRLRMDRISVEELRTLIQAGNVPLILDVRPSEVQQRYGVIPGAIATTRESLGSLVISTQDTSEIVVYCACPNEASAATIARLLLEKGFKRVRPLHGGIEAWRAAGMTVAAR